MKNRLKLSDNYLAKKCFFAMIFNKHLFSRHVYKTPACIYTGVYIQVYMKETPIKSRIKSLKQKTIIYPNYFTQNYLSK